MSMLLIAMVAISFFSGGSITSMLVVIAGMGGLFIYFLWHSQEKLLYQPRVSEQFIIPSQNPALFRNPKERGMPYENIYIRAKDETRLHCWFIHQSTVNKTKAAPTLLYLHANAGNMGFRLESLQQLHETLKVNIFIVSYRGYGESQGHPEEDGLCLDAEAALQYLRQRQDVDKQNIILFGRSLGGAVAVALANKHSAKLRGVILENTFTSISDLVNKMFPFVRPLKRWVLRLRWHSQDRIADVTAPILMISGQQDEVVPKEHMRSLYESAQSSAYRQITCFPNGKHNDTWKEGGLIYVSVLRRFLKRLSAIERPDWQA